MKTIGSIVWFILIGAVTGFFWCIAGIIWAFTLIGIPVAKQCFKIAKLCFFPFGKKVIYNSGPVSFLLNIFWFMTTGWELAIGSFLVGILFCATIIGIPFGKQCFKITKLALSPFGAEITK